MAWSKVVSEKVPADAASFVTIKSWHR